MRVGQTSLIVFLSKLTGSILGFVSTIYFARVLGAEVLGVYSVVIALVAWLQLSGRIGVGRALVKRISEGEDQGAYQMAGIIILAVLGTVLTIALVIGRPYVKQYVGDFEGYVDISVVWFIIVIFLLQLSTTIIFTTLQGQSRVHIVGLLTPVNIGVRSALQISLVVFFGIGLLALLVGHILALAFVTILGLAYVSVRPRLPTKEHFRSLYDYAKYAWLGGLQSRAFNDVDILVLGAAVSSKLVGIYSVAWGLTRFLDLFGGAIGQSVFPEISNISTQEGIETATKYINDAVAFSGFITIPGFFGGVLLSDRLLRIYGSEFVQGTEVLWLLLFSMLIFGYMRQFVNALNAIDRPKYAFIVNLVFTAANITLNIILVWQFGWVGAAVASAISSILGTIVSYSLLIQVVDLDLPLTEIGKQVASALLMGGIVWSLQALVETTDIVQHNFAIVLSLVAVGAGVYAFSLLIISSKFRNTVDRNIPVEIPLTRWF
jgi:O-antigen/teichoic acid export membrane protein